MAVLRPKDAAAAGMSPAGFHRAAQSGHLDRIARGLYRPADAPAADLDWIEAVARRPEATICLTSALAHHELIDTIPSSLDVAVPRGHRSPATTGAITWHHFDRDTFAVGRDEITIAGTANGGEELDQRARATVQKPADIPEELRH